MNALRRLQNYFSDDHESSKASTIAGYIAKIIVIGIISHLKETIAVDKPIKIPPTAPPSIVMFAARIMSCMSTHAHLGEEANVKI